MSDTVVPQQAEPSASQTRSGSGWLGRSVDSDLFYSFRRSRLTMVAAVVTVLFFLLAIGDFTAASPGFKHFTGYEGIFCGFSAVYAALAQVLNELSGRVVLPLGLVSK